MSYCVVSALYSKHQQSYRGKFAWMCKEVSLNFAIAYNHLTEKLRSELNRVSDIYLLYSL